jgi:O-antigen/teichoic acid export membrane protein
MPEPPPTPPVAPAPPGLLRRARGVGTSTMLLGTLVSAIGAYLFQVVGGRALGADAFAPVSVMWTVLFLGLTIFLIPVEQFVIRRLTLARGRGEALEGSWRVIVAVVAVATVLAIGFTIVARDGLLEGDAGYLPVAAVMFPGHALFILGRGFLAGRRRFVAYGVVVGLDAIGKVAGAVVVAVAGLGPVALSWALVLSPVVVLAVRPFGEAREEIGAVASGNAASDRRFMTGYLIATAASQTVLAAGPLVVGALGATPAAISVFFVTTTLFRGPMSASYNLIARVLPAFTRLAAAGEDDELSHWARRLAIGGAVAAGVTYAAASVLGPVIVEVLYGTEFRPSGTLAGLAAAAVIAGMVGLATTQILVARGATDRMAVVWVVALAAAALAIVVAPGEPDIRVAVGFLTGEAVALLGLTAAALVAPRERHRPA